MKFGVIIFPGSNCDMDTFHSVKSITDQDVEYIWHKDTDLKDCDCVILPGGFSYGDYLRAGAIARYSPIMKVVKQFAEDGGLVLGICNGFQILLEAGLLPGAMRKNRTGKFICKYVNITTVNNEVPFTSSLLKKEVLNIPIAHMEGNYYADEETLEKLIENEQIIFRYSNALGEIDETTNPNGSVYDIAGISNINGNVVGMMPHPERCCEKILGSSDGSKIFLSIPEYLR